MADDVLNPPVFEQMERMDELLNPTWLKQMRRMDELLNPTWLKQMRRMDGLLNPTWLKQMRRMDELLNPTWLKQMRRMDELLNPTWLKQMRRMDEPLNPTWLRAIQASHLPQTSATRAGIGRHLFDPRLTLIGAAQLTGAISPMAAPTGIFEALERASSSLLGQATIAAGLTSARWQQLSTEALSTLATLQLSEEDRGKFPNPDAPLVNAVVALQEAILATQHNLARFEEVLRKLLEETRNQWHSKRGHSWDIERILSFLGLLATISLGILQINASPRRLVGVQRGEAVAHRA
jgi:hypothetical protein